jgi:LysM repeat protein
MLRQNQVAQDHKYSYLKTSTGVKRFAKQGRLVRLKGSSHYKLDDEVSFPYARPEVKQFVERLGDQYYKACGERLVVTSLTRPITRQPRNASHLSVHPTGMAVDLRWSWHKSCRSWLEKTLLAMEQHEVIEATRESWPPHYHVTVFPAPYLRYIAKGASASSKQALAKAAPQRSSSKATPTQKTTARAKTTQAKPQLAKASPSSKQGKQVKKTVRVARGESLWKIAQRHRVSVAELKRANGMRSSQVQAGQRLQIPAR